MIDTYGDGNEEAESKRPSKKKKKKKQQTSLALDSQIVDAVLDG